MYLYRYGLSPLNAELLIDRIQHNAPLKTSSYFIYHSVFKKIPSICREFLFGDVTTKCYHFPALYLETVFINELREVFTARYKKDL
jgi:hypothetical protein